MFHDYFSKQTLPKSPKDVPEILRASSNEFVKKNYGTTLRQNKDEKSDFFRHAFQSNEYAFCIYASNDIINAINQEILPENRQYFMDGTFKVCPMGIFQQLLIVHVNFLGQIVPFMYVLMSNRTETAYRAVFQFMHENIQPLNCEYMVTDYERAMRNALAAVLPGIKLFGCHFHFAQALKRNSKKHLGMLNALKCEADAKKIYRTLLCLPLLPADAIVDVFNATAAEALQQYPNKFNGFLRYIKQQWLTRVRCF